MSSIESRILTVQNIVSIMQDQGILTPIAAQRAQALLADGRPLEEAVLAADGVSEEALLRFLAAAFDLTYVEVEKSAPAKEFLARFPARLLLKHHVLPLVEDKMKNAIKLPVPIEVEMGVGENWLEAH